MAASTPVPRSPCYGSAMSEKWANPQTSVFGAIRTGQTGQTGQTPDAHRNSHYMRLIKYYIYILVEVCFRGFRPNVSPPCPVCPVCPVRIFCPVRISASKQHHGCRAPVGLGPTGRARRPVPDIQTIDRRHDMDLGDLMAGTPDLTTGHCVGLWTLFDPQGDDEPRT